MSAISNAVDVSAILARHKEPHRCPREADWSACDVNRLRRLLNVTDLHNECPSCHGNRDCGEPLHAAITELAKVTM